MQMLTEVPSPLPSPLKYFKRHNLKVPLRLQRMTLKAVATRAFLCGEKRWIVSRYELRSSFIWFHDDFKTIEKKHSQ